MIVGILHGDKFDFMTFFKFISHRRVSRQPTTLAIKAMKNDFATAEIQCSGSLRRKKAEKDTFHCCYATSLCARLRLYRII